VCFTFELNAGPKDMSFLKLTKFSVATLFLLMVTLTNVGQGLKISLLLLIFILTSIIYYKRSFYFDRYLLIMTVLVVFVGLFGVFIGAINNTPGFISYIPLTIVYPFIIFYLSPICTRFSANNIDLFIIYLTIVTSIISLAFILLVFILNINFVGDFYKDIYGGVAYISHYDGENLKFMLPVIDFFVFSFPYLIISSIMKIEGNKHNRIRLLALLLSICVVLFSGRRAILVFSIFTLFLSNLFVLLFYPSKKLKSKVLKYSLLFIILVSSFFLLLSVLGIVDLAYLYSVILSSLNFTSNESNLERVIQYKFLLNGFYDNYMIGNGFGSVAGYQRSSKGWQYELQYMAWLFHGGLIVTFTYTLTLAFMFFVILKSTLSKVSNSNQIYFMITMSIGAVFLSNATNPYLSKFDMMWVFSLLVYCFIHSKKVSFINERI
jgi:hypothetical protein